MAKDEILDIMVEANIPSESYREKGFTEEQIENLAGLLREWARPVVELEIAALEAAGYVVVKLAEPTDADIDGDQYFSDGSAAGNVLVTPGSGLVCHGDWEWTVEQAMEVGRQWISAALVATPDRTVTH